MKRVKLDIKLNKADQLRKDIISCLNSSYEDTHPLSYLLLSLQTQMNKYTKGYRLVKIANT